MTRTAIGIVATGLVAITSAGCWEMPLAAEPNVIEQGPPRAQAPYLQRAAVDYDAGERGDSAVESALIWSEKYSQAMEKVLRLQNDNHDLEEKHKKLLEQVATLQAELAQSRKELTDANDLLIDMRQDLDRWKTNVLGFRQELRTAERAQLEALAKVIRLLGGEVPEPATQPSQKEAAKADETSSKPGA